MTDTYTRPYSNPAEAELDSWNDNPTAEEKLDATPDTALSREDLNWKKRHGDSQRHIGTLRQELSDMRTMLEKTQNELSVPKRSEALTQMAADHPDLVRVISEAANEEVAGLKTQMAELKSDRDKVNLKASQSSATAHLLSKHPDAPSIVKSNEWYDWVESLPQGVQTEIGDKAQYDGELISYYVGMFKASTGYAKSKAPSNQHQHDSSAARTVSRNQYSSPDAGAGEPKVWKESEILALNDKQYMEVADDIDKAHSEGRYINDMKRD